MKKDIVFKSNGVNCSAWHYQPEGEGPFPIIVMAHGLAGIKAMRLGAYAEEFAAAGYACLVFDYRYFGDSEGEPRQLLDIKQQHQDWRAAIEFASQLPNVDPDKIVLWGSSLSGGHVIELAAAVPSVAAVVAQVPFISAFSSSRTNSIKKSTSLFAHGLYDQIRALFGLKPHYILASSEPELLSLMNAPGQAKQILDLLPEGAPFDQRVAARFVIGFSTYFPIRKLPKLKMPVLLQVGLQDNLTPPGPAIKGHKKWPSVQLKQYDTGHFQPYLEPMFSEIVKDQIAFLNASVGEAVKL